MLNTRTDILKLWQTTSPDVQVELLDELVQITRRKKSRDVAWLVLRVFEQYFGPPGIPISLSRYPRDHVGAPNLESLATASTNETERPVNAKIFLAEDS